jgi:hypothetical protein
VDHISLFSILHNSERRLKLGARIRRRNERWRRSVRGRKGREEERNVVKVSTIRRRK